MLPCLKQSECVALASYLVAHGRRSGDNALVVNPGQLKGGALTCGPAVPHLFCGNLQTLAAWTQADRKADRGIKSMNWAPLLNHLRERFAIDWHGAHGAPHWVRVRKNGLILAQTTGANVKVVELFSFFHDSCRINEYADHDHGKRGAELAVTLRGDLFDATDEEMVLLVEACTGHSHGDVDADVTVQTCWDADRLDLGRVGIKPAAKYLCTSAAKDPVMMKSAYQRSLGKQSREN